MAAAHQARRLHAGPHAGHCALYAERADVLFSGDALATVSHLTGDTGPQLLAFNEDRDQALDSLARIETLAADPLLVGHGEPFEGAPAEAVAAVRDVAS